MLVNAEKLGSSIDTFKVSFMGFLCFLRCSDSESFKIREWLALVVVVEGEGVGIMCDGSDWAQRSLLLLLLLLLITLSK